MSQARDCGKPDVTHEHAMPIKGIWLYPLEKSFCQQFTVWRTVPRHGAAACLSGKTVRLETGWPIPYGRGQSNCLILLYSIGSPGRTRTADPVINRPIAAHFRAPRCV